MVAITEPYTAFCFDQACVSFGEAAEAAMDSVKGKGKTLRGKRENMLRKFLGQEQKFRSIDELRPGAKRERDDRPDPPFRME